LVIRSTDLSKSSYCKGRQIDLQTHRMLP
jgi:hypothetical protein